MEIAVKSTYARMLKDESLVQNSNKLYIVEFVFDESWNRYSKFAIFETGGIQQPPVALTDDHCIIPSECLKQAGVNLRIGVYGTKDGVQRDTIWCLTSRIMYSVDPSALIPPSSPSGDVTAQILEIIRENTATDEEALDAINEGFQTPWIPPGEDPDDESNTATDEEVEDVLDDVFGDES